jgi:BASS family bile acid:Na+ symporter
MLQSYLLIWLTASSGIAYAWPWPDADPFLAAKPVLSWLIAIIMLAIGIMLPHDEIKQVARRWPSVVGGTLIQYTAMPVLAFVMAKIWRIEGAHIAGLMLVGAVPGAMASNVLTMNARGNTSYSVSLTTSSTLLSPLAVPLALSFTLAGTSVKLDVQATVTTLLLTVVGPVVVGHLLSRWSERVSQFGLRWGATVANLIILWLIAYVVASTRDLLRVDRELLTVLGALVSVNILGYAAGYAGALALRLPDAMRRALTLEIGMQNAGLGTVLAAKLFSDSTTAIAPAMYTFGCMLTGTLLAQCWSRIPNQGADTAADSDATPSSSDRGPRLG